MVTAMTVVVVVVAVMTVMTVMTQVLNPDDVVVAMMRMTVQLCRMSVVAVLAESGLMAMVARLNLMPRWRSMRQWYHSCVMVSLELLVGNRMHKPLLFHFSRSLAVPYLLLCAPSWVWRGRHPLVGVPLVASDEFETLTTGLVPSSRASFFDFDAADDLGPAHSVRGTFFEGESGLKRRR